MAPMTRGVTDRQEYGFACLTSNFECLFGPWLPLHGIVSVLQQVRAGLLGESVLDRI